MVEHRHQMKLTPHIPLVASIRITEIRQPVVRPEFAAEAQRIRELREAHAQWIRLTRRVG